MKKIIIAGSGGQGIVSMGKIMAYSAMGEGLNVSCIPSYGPEMRGGTANCCVVYDKGLIQSPVFDSANILVAMNQMSADKYSKRVCEDGLILIDSDIECGGVEAYDKRVLKLPMSAAAESAGGDRKTFNMVVLGVLSRLFNDFSVSEVINSIGKFFKDKQKAIDISIRAFHAGFALV